MKEQILKLREEGKTYAEIKDLLGCSSSTISYYCGKDQKDKTIQRTTSYRKENPFGQKVCNFKSQIRTKVEKFKRTNPNKKEYLPVKNIVDNFSPKEAMRIIGDDPTCYLTGRKIDLKDSSSYQLDHKKPASKGGDNSLENMGLACAEANQAKHNLSIDQFIQLCKEILQYNGYNVISKSA